MNRFQSMIEHLLNHPIGLFHTLISIVAIIFGTLVLLNTKGTKLHKRLGYIYVTSMLLLNISAFFIVSFGGFSIFHFFAIISLLGVLGGIIPAIMRVKNWFAYHFYFMSWSVVGLYCALWAEIGTRFVSNMKQFWWIVFLSLLITSFIGSKIINKQAKKLNLR